MSGLSFVSPSPPPSVQVFCTNLINLIVTQNVGYDKKSNCYYSTDTDLPSLSRQSRGVDALRWPTMAAGPLWTFDPWNGLTLSGPPNVLLLLELELELGEQQLLPARAHYTHTYAGCRVLCAYSSALLCFSVCASSGLRAECIELSSFHSCRF